MMRVCNLDRVCALTSQDFLYGEKTCVLGREVAKGKKVEAKDVEGLVTKALGVLQEQGVYAFVLFLYSRSGDNKQPHDMNPESFAASALLVNLMNMLNRKEFRALGVAFLENNETVDVELDTINSKKGMILRHFAEMIASDLDTLLAVKRLFEGTLIYTRYGAKAFSVSEKGGEEQS